MSSDTKTRKRTEDATGNRAKHGDSSFAKRVDAGPMNSISFRVTAGPPALPCRDDALVDKGAEVPKLCLSPVEMRTLTAAGGILPAGIATTATRTILYQPPLWNLFPIEYTNFRTTSIQYATFSSFRQIKRLETKSSKIPVFDPGGYTGRLRACPFLGWWRALPCGEAFVWTPEAIRG